MDSQFRKISSTMRKIEEIHRISLLMTHLCRIEVSWLQHGNMKQAVGILQNWRTLSSWPFPSLLCGALAIAQLSSNVALPWLPEQALVPVLPKLFIRSTVPLALHDLQISHLPPAPSAPQSRRSSCPLGAADFWDQWHPTSSCDESHSDGS